MRKSTRLGRWDAATVAYLSSRHALGRAYRKEEWILGRLRAYLVRHGAPDLDQTLFDHWRRRFRHTSASTRLVYEITVYNFCRYRRRSDPRCFLPDRLELARAQPHPLPTLIERHQLVRLLAYVSTVRPTTCNAARAGVLRLAIVLLYTAGLRRGEVARLTLGDVDAGAGVLRIRESKFHKSRWVPLSRTATQELRGFLAARRAMGADVSPAAPLLCSKHGQPYSSAGLGDSLKNVLVRSGIWAGSGRCPRVQDYRHSFAVAALLRWYEADADVQANLPKLALYMGHVSIVSTAYYLRFMPAVIARAGERFARACGDLVDGGAP